MKKNFETKLISTQIASARSGYNSDYLGRLCKSKRIQATQVGRVWLIDEKSLEKFIRDQKNLKEIAAKKLSKKREEDYRLAQSKKNNASNTTKNAAAPVPSPYIVRPINQGVPMLYSKSVALMVAMMFVTATSYASTLEFIPNIQRAAVSHISALAHENDFVALNSNGTVPTFRNTEPLEAVAIIESENSAPLARANVFDSFVPLTLTIPERTGSDRAYKKMVLTASAVSFDTHVARPVSFKETVVASYLGLGDAIISSADKAFIQYVLLINSAGNIGIKSFGAVNTTVAKITETYVQGITQFTKGSYVVATIASDIEFAIGLNIEQLALKPTARAILATSRNLQEVVPAPTNAQALASASKSANGVEHIELGAAVYTPFIDTFSQAATTLGSIFNTLRVALFNSSASQNEGLAVLPLDKPIPVQVETPAPTITRDINGSENIRNYYGPITNTYTSTGVSSIYVENQLAQLRNYVNQSIASARFTTYSDSRATGSSGGSASSASSITNGTVSNSTITGGTISGATISTNSFSLNAYDGPLQANGGVVTATTSIGVLYGGTGLTTAPSYGQLLLGNGLGGYTYVSTSSLGFGNGTGSVVSVDASGGTTGLTFTGGPVTSSGVFTLGGTLGVASGGTGSTTLSGLLKGNGTGGLLTAVAGTDYQLPGNYITALTGDATASGPGSAVLTLATVNGNVGTFNNVTVNAKGLVTSASNVSYLTSAITALGPVGQLQSGATVTLATTTSTTNGLTSALTITGSGNTLTYTPSLSGTLGISGGGTNTTSQTANGVTYFNGTSITSGTGLTFDGTNFGVGTTTPSMKLSVQGNGLFSGDLSVANFIASGTARVATLSIGSLSGFLKATAGTVATSLIDLSTDVTSTLPMANGGTGMTSYSAGALLYANLSGTLTTLPIGATGKVLKVIGGVPAWSDDLTGGGGGGGGDGVFATSTNLIYPASLSSTVVIGDSSTSTLSSIFEVHGSSYFSGNVGIGSTTPTYKLSIEGISSLGTRAFAGYFTATTTTASTFPYASTTALTVAGTNGLTLGTLNGPLQANNGVVSATSSIGVLYGGTGLTSAPAFGQLLVGNGSGYTLTATSSLGLGTVTSVQASGGTTGLSFTGGPVTTSGTLTLGGTLGIANGGTNTTSQTANGVTYFNGTSITSGTGLTFDGTNFGVGTTTPSMKLSVQGNGLFSGDVTLANLTATGTASVLGLTVSTLNGPLQANNGVVSATSSVGVRYGGTGLTSVPTFGQMLVGNGSGYTLTATSSLGLVTSVQASGGTTGLTFTGGPVTTSGTLTLGGTLGVANGGTGSTTLSGILVGNGTSSLLTATISSPLSFSGSTLSISQAASGVSGYLSSADWALFNNKISSSSLSATYPLSYNSGTGVFSTAFSTTTTNTFSGLNTFNGGLTVSTLNGPLQANNGVVSATSSIGVLYGGTGLSSTPALGQLLVGNGSGYTLTATSSLGIALADTTGTLAIARGGTNAISQTTNGVTYFNGTSITSGTGLTFNGTNFGIATSSPGSLLSIGGVANFTTATTTFYGTGGINIAGGCYAVNGVCITAGGGGGGISAIGPLGQTQSGSTITLATTTSTTNGLTSALTITGSANTLTYTPSLSGTLTVGGGGTGLSSTPALGQLLVGNGSGYTLTATSSLGIALADTTGTLAIARGGTNAISQTTNGVTYFDGTSITSGSGLVFTGTNFGIGTSTPGSPLSVAGNGYFSGDVSVGNFTTLGTATIGGITTITSNAATALTVGPNGSTNPVLAVVANTASSASGISITGAATGAATVIAATDPGSNGLLTIRTKGNGQLVLGGNPSNTSSTAGVSLQSGGSTRYQIGTYSHAFSVAGNGTAATARFSFTVASDSALTASTEAPAFVLSGATRQHSTGALTLQRDFRVSGSDHSFVGASTLTDQAAFSVDLSTGSSANGTITNIHNIYVPSTALTGTKTNSYGLTINANTGATNNYAAQFMGGNVGIGTSTPTAQLHTTGSVRFSTFGSGTLQTDANGNVSVSSDERLKDINGSYTRGLADIQKLSPILYHWNATSKLDENTQYAGFSAQNVQAAIPEAVGVDPRGYLTLQDRPIIAASVNAIIELAGKTNTLSLSSTDFAARLATVEQTSALGPIIPAALSVSTVSADTLALTGSARAASLSVSGEVWGGAFITSENAFADLLTSTTTTLPAEVLGVNGGIDIGRLAMMSFIQSQKITERENLLTARIDALDARVAALEAGSTTASSTVSSGTLSLAAETIKSALSSLGILIENGIARFNTIAFNQVIATANPNGDRVAGSSEIGPSQSTVTIHNSLISDTSKVFLTLTSPAEGSWYVAEKKPGMFTIAFSQPQTATTTFDYFFVGTDESSQAAAVSTVVLPPNPTPNTGSNPPPVVGDTTPPTVSLLGSATPTLTVGEAWTDPGATADDAVDGDITSKIITSGSVDTAVPGIYTITYSVTDAAGNEANVSRAVIVSATDSGV